jgi:hypothetical protein
MNYARDYDVVLKYMMNDGEAMMKGLMLPEHREAREGGWPEDQEAPIVRGVLADWMNDYGRDHEAELLRGNGHVIAHEGSIVPAKVVWEDARYDADDPETMERLDNDPEEVYNDLRHEHTPGQNIREHNTNRFTEKAPWGSGDYTHESPEGHVLAWNPHLNYYSLNYRHEVPTEGNYLDHLRKQFNARA